MNFKKIINKYREIAFSDRDKGDRFERLIQAYLKTDPRYSTEFKEVWLWNEFPYKSDFGGKDVGIDIVAKTHQNEYWAVQCKCYQENVRITKGDVDTFLATSGKIFFDENEQQQKFSHRLWISTTNKWNSEAENVVKNQNPPVSRLSLLELEEAPVDWKVLDEGIFGNKARFQKKVFMKHQLKAVNSAHEYFKNNDRGKLIMACGTGKTFTSLKIAESETNGNGLILFLVPSIALLGQALNEWCSDAEDEMHAICVCSDPATSKKSSKNEKDDNLTSITDLALPASTNVANIIKQFKWMQQSKKKGMTVVFSTYQSIDVIAKAQSALIADFGDKAVFDLIICDEAHRTTGVILAGSKDESAFTKVHDNQIIKSKKRLYMTATPRLYNETSKQKAAQNDYILCSMDDKSLYGEEIYRIGFGEAVQNNLLSDYKVLVLTITEDQVPEVLQKAISDPNYEINTDDATKLVGCINALSKRMVKYVGSNDEGELLKTTDPNPMHTAVAFCPKIKDSKKITDIFNLHSGIYYESLSEIEREEVVNIEAAHIDGSMGAMERNEKLSWLKHAPTDGKECRILTNVRCLSEGVDVPSLDAVMFLSAKNSQVDVVQSVGRVMRKAPGKKYGYIIIPVVVRSDVKPEEALDNNPNFKVVWTVLNALRAHDDRFNAMVNKIELNKKNPNDNGRIIVGGIPNHEDDGGTNDTGKSEKSDDRFSENVVKQLTMQFGELQSVIYARMVQKVGSRKYWEQWAKDIARIARRHVDRITRIVGNAKYQAIFEEFMNGLHVNINPYITKEEAIEMLAQHIITRPVFEALFENYSFVKNNSVSIAMQKILDALDENAVGKENEILEKFYADVKLRCEGIDNAEGKQKIIVELYDKFFKTALPKVVEKLGIVYTPVEVVDFIVNSVSDVLKKEFNRDISGENVHILDPFTGTGTFITRLLQSGRIKKADLKRKYEEEIHANEIVLLAYYIASVNIENTYHDLIKAKEGEYQNFEGICLTDTFQLNEDEGKIPYSEYFPKNVKRVQKQRETPITVIIGNPPYSVGQKSANDGAQNQKYDNLDRRVAETYVAASKVTNKKSLYDSYIKAFRWASDRLNKTEGIIGFISNGSWIDSNAMDGFRGCLEKEFSSVYVFNLRGNQRTSGETSRKEGGKIFGSGSRTPISITILVKNPNRMTEKATIYYHDIGDYLSREEKLKIVSDFGTITNPKLRMEILQPNEHNDWLNQRNEIFSSFILLEPDKKFDEKSKSVFSLNSIGFQSARDAWVYNSSKGLVSRNMQKTIDFYNEQLEAFRKCSGVTAQEFISRDSTKISWSSSLISHFSNLKSIRYENKIEEAMYRPFFKQFVYTGEKMIHRRGQFYEFFPSHKLSNLIINVSGVGNNGILSTYISKQIMDSGFNSACQCFPLYWYEEKFQKTSLQGELYKSENSENNDKYTRHDGITDFIHNIAKEKYGHKVTKEDIFYYVYGILHSMDYRTKFTADLKKMLPRIPLVEKFEDFLAFSDAGRDLAKLHLNYEDQAPLSSVKVYGEDIGIFAVDKMKFKSKNNKSEIIYNKYIRITNIPETAYEYVINGKSAIEWILDRYQIRVDKESQIKNNPNDWAEEHNNPRYILDLLLSVISLSVATVKIMKSLPKLNFEDEINE